MFFSFCEWQYDWGSYPQVSLSGSSQIILNPQIYAPPAENFWSHGFRYYGTNKVMASIVRHDKSDAQAEEKLFRLEDFPVHEKLEKFMEDVK